MRDNRQLTPLHMACINNHAPIAKRLLDAPGVYVNAADDSGGTALRTSSSLGHVEVVEVLLAAPGVDVNQQDQNGFNPLHMACGNGHVEVSGAVALRAR